MIIRRSTLLAVLPATTGDDTRYFLNAVRIEPPIYNDVDAARAKRLAELAEEFPGAFDHELLGGLNAEAGKNKRLTDATIIDRGPRAVTTNGHVLLLATETSPEPDSEYPAIPSAPFHGDPLSAVLLPVDVAKSLIASTPKKSTIPILQWIQIGRNGNDHTITAVSTDLTAINRADVDQANLGTFPAYDRVLPKDTRAELAVTLGVPVLETLIKAAKAAGSHTVTFGFPTKDPKNVLEAIRIAFKGSDVTVTGCAMPCRI